MPEAEVLALKLVLCKCELAKFSRELKRCQDRILVNREKNLYFNNLKNTSLHSSFLTFPKRLLAAQYHDEKTLLDSAIKEGEASAR